jgi:hypothetical protein
MPTHIAAPPIGHEASNDLRREDLGRVALTGILLFAVSIGTWTPEGAPTPGETTAAQIRRFAEENSQTLRLNTLAALLAAGLLIYFVAGLAQLVRQVRPSSSLPGVLLVCGAVAVIQSMLLVAASSIFAFPHEMEDLADVDVVTLYTFTAVIEWLTALTVVAPCMILVGSFSLVALRSRIVTPWICGLGLLLAALGAAQVLDIALPGHVTDSFFLVVLFGWWLWPLLIGCAFGVRWVRNRT